MKEEFPIDPQEKYIFDDIRHISEKYSKRMNNYMKKQLRHMKKTYMSIEYSKCEKCGHNFRKTIWKEKQQSKT